ncbi:MAG: phy [Phycisphaerales bacterium]|nr:phy [Phycisphaerales bacterium]
MVVFGLLAFALAAPRGSPADGGPVVTPLAIVETTPVPHEGDSADDPAIWVHPTDPGKSLILGTDKQGGLISYGMDGRQVQIVSDGARPNNVDVVYDFPLGAGRADLAVAGCRDSKSLGLKVWRIDAETRRLGDVTAGGFIPVFGHSEPYGSCVYHSRKSGKFYAFVNNKNGAQEQYELTAAGDTIAGTKVRAFKLKSITEGTVCDDEAGALYVAEERVGIWRFSAEPDGGSAGKLIAKVGEHGLAADVEGLTLYCAAGGKGYLIASSQGNNTFKVYAREGDNGFVCTIDPRGGAIDDVSDTDGIAVTNRPTSTAFPKGFLIVQDGSKKGGHQNFKLYRWEDIAGDRLWIDTSEDPRRR